MNNLEKAKFEKAIAEGWFNGKYTQKTAELTAEKYNLEMVMVKYWYGLLYSKQESNSAGVEI